MSGCTIQFKIYADPLAQQRGKVTQHWLCFRCKRKAPIRRDSSNTCPRCGARMGTVGGIKDPEQSKTWKGDVKLLAQRYRQEPLWDGPIRMDLLFEIQKPKSERKGAKWKEKKPDLDNLEKGVKDALEGVIYRNDARIVSKGSEKVHVGVLSEAPGVTVRLKQITHEECERMVWRWRKIQESIQLTERRALP